MKRLFAFVSIVCCLVAVGASTARGEHTKETVDQIEKNLGAGKAVLLDVREPRETNEGFVDGALLVPLSILQEGRGTADFGNVLGQRLSKKSIIYCYCAAGGRAIAAADILKEFGYDARALKPGFKDLAEAGFITSKPKPAK